MYEAKQDSDAAVRVDTSVKQPFHPLERSRDNDDPIAALKRSGMRLRVERFLVGADRFDELIGQQLGHTNARKHVSNSRR